MCFDFQCDRLQTRLQEQQLVSSQAELTHKAESADKDDVIVKTQADLRVMAERFANAQNQVSVSLFLPYVSTAAEITICRSVLNRIVLQKTIFCVRSL